MHIITNPEFGDVRTFLRDTGHIVIQQGHDLILLSHEAANKLCASLIEFTGEDDEPSPEGESNVIPLRRAAAA